MSNQLPIPTGNKLKFGEIKKKNLKKKNNNLIELYFLQH